MNKARLLRVVFLIRLVGKIKAIKIGFSIIKNYRNILSIKRSRKFYSIRI